MFAPDKCGVVEYHVTSEVAVFQPRGGTIAGTLRRNDRDMGAKLCHRRCRVPHFSSRQERRTTAANVRF